MADILLQYPQSPNALLLGLRPSAFPAWGGQIVGSSQFAGLTQSSFCWSWYASFSPDAQAFDKSIQLLLCDWAWLRQNLSSGVVEDLEVSYDSTMWACATAQEAPNMMIDDDDMQAYAGLSDFSYTLDDDD